MDINREIADNYQDFFNFFCQEHNLILTIEMMNEILTESKKLECKLNKETQSNINPVIESALKGFRFGRD